jgi:hypothetical protein
MPTDDTLSRLDDAIESGVTRTSADGHSAEQSLEHLERIRRDLRLRDPESISAGLVRPALVRLRLGGAW